MLKKGQSISINTIIVAAIALAVLVVLFMIFTGRMGIFSKGVSETTDCNQACKAAGYTLGTPYNKESESCDEPRKNLVGYNVIVNGKQMGCCCTV